jgi:hypothetical protein
MANEKVDFKEEISIKKTTMNDKGEAVKITFFFPDKGVSIEASSMEEALKLLKAKGGEKLE